MPGHPHKGLLHQVFSRALVQGKRVGGVEQLAAGAVDEHVELPTGTCGTEPVYEGPFGQSQWAITPLTEIRCP